jgi:hypothetical protein
MPLSAVQTLLNSYAKEGNISTEHENNVLHPDFGGRGFVGGSFMDESELGYDTYNGSKMIGGNYSVNGPTPWVRHVKEFAAQNGLTYAEALKHPAIRVGYQKVGNPGGAARSRQHRVSYMPSKEFIRTWADQRGMSVSQAKMYMPQIKSEFKQIKMKFLDPSGGFGLSDVWNGIKKAHSFVKDNKIISTVAGLIPHPIAQGVALGATALGYGSLRNPKLRKPSSLVDIIRATEGGSFYSNQSNRNSSMQNFPIENVYGPEETPVLRYPSLRY